MLSIIGVLIAALAFEYVNGFHDTANAIATTVSTKVLAPRQAVVLAAVFNLVGALTGVAVAATIGQGLVDTNFIGPQTIFCALLGAILWNLFTWWLGLPSSSSHALIGGLCGAALAAAHGNLAVVYWTTGLWAKVILPMLISPLLGALCGYLVMSSLFVLLHRATPHWINSHFGKLQLVSAAGMAFSHGTNDAQKTMGIIALTLYTATREHVFDHLPSFFVFLKTPQFEVALWIKILCAVTMAAGTAVGGWRIIKTLGHKVVRLQPVHGFASETSAALIIQIATHWGIPLSTTHVISSAVMGVGTAKRHTAVKWQVVSRMVWAWLLTIPLTGLIAYVLERFLR